MVIPKFARGIGGKFIGGLGPTAISIIYDKVKKNLEKYVNEYLNRRKEGGAVHLSEADASKLERVVSSYASKVFDDVKEKLSYFDNRVNYVNDAANKGRIAEPLVYHAGNMAKNLFNQLFNYPFKKYADIEQRVTYNSDTARRPDYIGNGLQKVKEALDWWEDTDEWVKRVVYGAAKRIEKMALLRARKKTGLPIEEHHLDAIVKSTAKSLGRLKEFVQTTPANYGDVVKALRSDYASDFNPYGARVYGAAS